MGTENEEKEYRQRIFVRIGDYDVVREKKRCACARATFGAETGGKEVHTCVYRNG